jgi:hypothetical protein
VRREFHLAAQIAELAQTPAKAARAAVNVLVTPKWTPDALPAVDPRSSRHRRSGRSTQRRGPTWTEEVARRPNFDRQWWGLLTA